MKNQVLVGCRVFKKNQVRVKLGWGPRKTLPVKTCITGEVIHRHKGLEYMCLQQCQIFHGHRIFQHLYHVTSFKSINIVFETGKHHSWPNTLPFRVRYWGVDTRVVPVPALVLTHFAVKTGGHFNCNHHKAFCTIEWMAKLSKLS